MCYIKSPLMYPTHREPTMRRPMYNVSQKSLALSLGFAPLCGCVATHTYTLIHASLTRAYVSRAGCTRGCTYTSVGLHAPAVAIIYECAWAIRNVCVCVHTSLRSPIYLYVLSVLQRDLRWRPMGHAKTSDAR